MRLDSHQHFWQYNHADYVWMLDTMVALRRDYLPATLEPRLRAIGFDGTIAVQARQMLAESDWLLDLADGYPFIRGVVGWVDFASAQLEAELERLADRPKLRGVRELIHDMPDVDYATSDVHVRGIAKLARFGLTYDLLLKPAHIRPAIGLVRRFPDQPFVVDHLAKPDIANRVRSPWREDIQQLANHQNVFCKLSGMVTEAHWGRWRPADFRPYLDIVLEAFGPYRVMIGSDWPVCTLSGDYEDVMQIVVDYVAQLTPSERENILGNNCAGFYSIPITDRMVCVRA
jgi:L-fuconolactonase